MIKDRLEKIDKLRPYLTAHSLGLIILGLILLSVSWSGVKAIQKNHELQKQADKLSQQNTIQSLENQTLELRNKFYSTDEYVELNARRQFGLAAPGEKLIMIDTDVALSYIKETEHSVAASEAESPSGWRGNVQSWLDFLFNRRQDTL